LPQPQKPPIVRAAGDCLTQTFRRPRRRADLIVALDAQNRLFECACSGRRKAAPERFERRQPRAQQPGKRKQHGREDRQRRDRACLSPHERVRELRERRFRRAG
jgi:hypothetical protein